MPNRVKLGPSGFAGHGDHLAGISVEESLSY